MVASAPGRSVAPVTWLSPSRIISSNGVILSTESTSMVRMPSRTPSTLAQVRPAIKPVISTARPMPSPNQGTTPPR